jgi:hypothetical protein
MLSKRCEGKLRELLKLKEKENEQEATHMLKTHKKVGYREIEMLVVPTIQFPCGDSGRLLGHTSSVVVSSSISHCPLLISKPSGQARPCCWSGRRRRRVSVLIFLLAPLLYS